MFITYIISYINYASLKKTLCFSKRLHPHMHVEGLRKGLPAICKAGHRILPRKGSAMRGQAVEWGCYSHWWARRLRLTEVIRLIPVHTTNWEWRRGFWLSHLLLSSHKDKWLYRNCPIRCRDVRPPAQQQAPCVLSGSPHAWLRPGTWLVSPPRAVGKNEFTNPAYSAPWIYWKLTVPAEIKATFYGSEHMRCRRYVHQEDAPKINSSGAGTTAFFIRLREGFWGAFRNVVNWRVLEGDKFTWNSRKGPRSHPVCPVIQRVGESHGLCPLLRLPPPSRLEAVPRLLTSSLLLFPPHLSVGPFYRQVGRREGGILSQGSAPGKM